MQSPGTEPEGGCPLTPPIPPQLASFPWYAPHLAWLRSMRATTEHDPGDAAPAQADLTGADLTGADLTKAMLFGTKLSSTNLSRADLSGAFGIMSTGPVGAERRIVYGVRHADRIMVQAGCSWRSLDDTRAAVLARYADGSGREQYRAGYLAALDAIAAVLGGAK